MYEVRKAVAKRNERSRIKARPFNDARKKSVPVILLLVVLVCCDDARTVCINWTQHSMNQ